MPLCPRSHPRYSSLFEGPQKDRELLTREARCGLRNMAPDQGPVSTSALFKGAQETLPH